MRKQLQVAAAIVMAFLVATPSALADKSTTGNGRDAPADEVAVFTELDDGTMLHEPSGLNCPPTIGDFTRNSVQVLDPEGRGRDISCDYEARFDGRLGKLTLFVTDWGADYPEAEIMQGTVAAILQRYPDAKPYDGISVTLTEESLGFDPVRATFLVDIDGVSHVSGAWIQNRKGWSLKLRLTVPEGPWQTQMFIANASMMLVFGTITKEARP